MQKIAILSTRRLPITNAQANDVLAVGTLPAGITASIAGNVVTLSGSGTLTQYQSALQAVTFANTSNNPYTASRNIDVVLNDGSSASSTVAHTTVNVVSINDAPITNADT